MLEVLQRRECLGKGLARSRGIYSEELCRECMKLRLQPVGGRANDAFNQEET